MGKPTGFKEFERELPRRRPLPVRVKDWDEIYEPMPEDKLRTQGARCMDCGVPFCHSGCPLGNLVPDWNDLVYTGRWRDALEMLHKTNNFPDFTGRVCPAPCEEACVLGINEQPVTIKLIEQSIVDVGFENGWIQARPPETRTGKRVAIVGSGPAGLAAAAQLNRAGHLVTVFERADRPGGLLMYGIPNFKLDKRVVMRRIDLMSAEGVTFAVNADVGGNVDVDDLRRDFDAILLAAGSTHARDLDVPGRELGGIHLAMEYLPKQNRAELDGRVDRPISAEGKHVVILGGGDTGADCLGTAIRQGAASVRQFELLARPPESRTLDMPWPTWPMTLRSATAHEEGEALTPNLREWSVNTTRFSGADGVVERLHAVRLEWVTGADGRLSMQEVAGSELELPCDLCLLALGFVHPEHPGPIEQLGVELDPRGNVLAGAGHMTSVPGVFAAGDARRGQSLVVWAIAEGRAAARGMDAFLMGRSDLP